VTEYLDVEDLIYLAADLGVGPVRDVGLLAAAAGRPQAALMGRDTYPSLEAKTAALLHSLVSNHPLENGNERLGWFAAAVFLRLNDRDIALAQDQASALTVAVASGEIRDVDEVAVRLPTKPR
jgi:death-on-curing protein